MKASVVAGLLWSAMSAVSTAVASTSVLYPNSPLLLWSERSVFSGKNAYSSATMNEQDVAFALKEAAQGKNNWGLLNNQQDNSRQAELLCVFLLPSLSADEVSSFAVAGERSFVQTAVQGAASSVVVTHTTRTSSLSHALSPIAPVVSHSDLKDAIASGGSWHSLLSDGKTNVVVVEIFDTKTLPEADAIIKSAAQSLSQATGGLTDFALTADDAVPVEAINSYTRRLAAQESSATATITCDVGYIVGYTQAGKAFCFSHYVHMTPELLTGLIFGALFVFLAYIGLTVLHGIQTPTKYPLHGPPRGKEF